jgi:hypothetical protein
MPNAILWVLIAMASLIPATAQAQTSIPIDQTLTSCRQAGAGPIPGVRPVQSDLKKETSLIGMAYLNYIYQNDIANRHFCQAMLLMGRQVPAGTANPYVRLFTPEQAAGTMAVLADVQLAFDYAIARSRPSADKVRASIDAIRKTMR